MKSMKVTLLHNEETDKILVSVNRHDYKSVGDAFIDGGQEMLFRYNESGGYKLKTVESELFHKQLSEQLCWGVRLDKDGNPTEPKTVPICELNSGHIKAILQTQNKINNLYKTVMEQELKNREKYKLDTSKTYKLENLTESEREIIFKLNFEGDKHWEGITVGEFKVKGSDFLKYVEEYSEWDWLTSTDEQTTDARELFDITNTALCSAKIIGSFNVSGDSLVDSIKAKASELVDLINSIEGEEEYKKLAVTNIAQGQMWAVKAIFTK